MEGIKQTSNDVQTTIKGQVVHLTGPPISVPPLEEDNLEVIVGHGVLVLLSISAERTEHETNLFSILSLLKTDTFQVMHFQKYETLWHWL